MIYLQRRSRIPRILLYATLIAGARVYSAQPGANRQPAMACLNKAMALYKEGRLSDAEILLRAALLLDPGNPAPQFWLGRCCLDQKNFDEAESNLKAVLARRPNSAETLYWIGRVYESRKQFEEAVNWYGKALESDPKHKDSRLALARVRGLLQITGPPLVRKLRSREQVLVAALGDSITFGLGVPDAQQNAFPALFVRCLRERFDNPNVALLNCGDPGSPAFYALTFLESHVLSRRPDLVIVQLGGNDSRMNTPLPDFCSSLAEIVSGIRKSGDAEILLCVPPMLESKRDGEIIQAIKDEGRKSNLAVADFDAALKSAEHDYRGLFPWEGHPNEYSHVIMAKELDRAFTQLAGIKAKLSVAIQNSVDLSSPGQTVRIPVVIQNLTAMSQEGTCTLWIDGKSMEQRFVLLPMDRGTTVFTCELPKNHTATRTLTQRLWASARTRSDASFDVKWLTIAPTRLCVQLDETAAEGEFPRDMVTRSRMVMEEACIQLGRPEWRGLSDLSAVCDTGIRKDKLVIRIEVNDQRIITGTDDRPWEGDSVELYFDLRPQPDQGKPFYDKNVFILYLIPSTDRTEPPLWKVLCDTPPALTGIQLKSRAVSDGYGFELALSLNSVRKIAGDAIPTIGFDVAVNDADSPGKRKAQMFWAGRTDDYLNPRYFGTLILAAGNGNETFRVTVH